MHASAQWIHVADPQGCHLAPPQPRVGQEPHHRAVGFALDRQSLDLIGGQESSRLGELAGEPYTLSRIGRQPAIPHC